MPAPELEAQLAAKNAELKTARAKLDAIDKRLEAGQAAWEQSAVTYQPKWEVLTPGNLKAGRGVTLKTLPDGSVLAGGAMPPSSFYELTGKTAMRNITAFRIEMLPDASLPGGGSGRGAGGKGVVTLFEARMGSRKVDLSRITADFKSEESELDLVVRPVDQLKRGWGVNPQMNQRHYAVIETARMQGSGEEMTLSFRIGNEYEGAPVGRFRISVTNSEYPEVIPAEMAAILRTAAGDRTAKDAAALTKYFVTHPVERRLASQEVARLDAERRTIENKIPSTMVMAEMATPRDTFVLVRGAYDKPGEKVTPAVPAFLPPMPKDAPDNRLGLARWLVDPANPLTARVAVNRYWQMYFGTGLVKTSEDFGSQGEAPSHPELLDWLEPSRTAGLAGHRIHSVGLGCEGDAAAHSYLRRLPSGFQRHGSIARTRSRKSPDCAGAARAPAGRDDPRSGAAGFGTAEHEDGRPFGEAVPARRTLGAALGLPGQETFRTLHGRRPVAPQCLQLLEANCSAAFDDDFRRAHARVLRGAPPDEFHAAAGTGAAQ
ncbi:hypothetical protein SBA3_2580014 [Candidatus Sulfopaludibacter sp. SbA3]|nr:hypothetical protein SBA3_2580014 [Candidatus Sulfopaludibacter sp. SbA3]